MSNGKRTAFIIIATIFYSCLWVCLLCLIVGFFMPTPVRFCKNISGRPYRTSNSKQTSKYGLSDDPALDEAMFYESVVYDD